MNDKQQELLMDVTHNEVLSNCCGAPVYRPTSDWAVCKDCKEYCSVFNTKGEDEFQFDYLPSDERNYSSFKHTVDMGNNSLWVLEKMICILSKDGLAVEDWASEQYIWFFKRYQKEIMANPTAFLVQLEDNVNRLDEIFENDFRDNEDMMKMFFFEIKKLVDISKDEDYQMTINPNE